jgi:hypothetical protein
MVALNLRCVRKSCRDMVLVKLSSSAMNPTLFPFGSMIEYLLACSKPCQATLAIAGRVKPLTERRTNLPKTHSSSQFVFQSLAQAVPAREHLCNPE